MKDMVFNFQCSVFSAIALLAAAISMGAAPVVAQDAAGVSLPTVEVVVSTAKVQVAEPFEVKLTVTAPAGTQITLPPVAEKLGEFDVINYQDVVDLPAADGSNARIWKRQLRLESIVTGDLHVPAMEVQTRTAESTDIVRSDVVPVHVVSVLEDRADPKQFRDIRSVVDLTVPTPERSRNWILWAVGGLALVTVSAASVMLVARREAWLTPAAWAHQELAALQDSESVTYGDFEFVTSELSSLLRRYLELQFEVAATTQTSNELLETIQKRELLSADLAARFSGVFDSTDLAKFAGVQMTPSELESAIDEARQLVDAAASEIVQVQSNAEAN